MALTIEEQHETNGIRAVCQGSSRARRIRCLCAGTTRGANAVFHKLNRRHGVVVISGQNSKEHSLPGRGCRFEICIRVRLSQEIRPYTSIGVHPKAGYLVFVNDPLPIPRKRTGLETGIDRGCVHSLALADGSFIDLPKNPLEKIDREIRRRQKAQARRVRQSGLSAKEYMRGGHRSNRYMQEQKQISRLYRQAHRIIDDFQQQVSHRLVSEYDLIVLEDLNLQGMSRKAKPVPDPLHPGRFLPNGQAAKRGLNHALRSASMGGIRQKTRIQDPTRVCEQSPAREPRVHQPAVQPVRPHVQEEPREPSGIPLHQVRPQVECRHECGDQHTATRAPATHIRHGRGRAWKHGVRHPRQEYCQGRSRSET